MKLSLPSAKVVLDRNVCAASCSVITGQVGNETWLSAADAAVLYDAALDGVPIGTASPCGSRRGVVGGVGSSHGAVRVTQMGARQ